jgi:hypothetical protein
LTEFLLRSIPHQLFCKSWIHSFHVRPWHIQHFIKILAPYNWNRFIKATTVSFEYAYTLHVHLENWLSAAYILIKSRLLTLDQVKVLPLVYNLL